MSNFLELCNCIAASSKFTSFSLHWKHLQQLELWHVCASAMFPGTLSHSCACVSVQ